MSHFSADSTAKRIDHFDHGGGLDDHALVSPAGQPDSMVGTSLLDRYRLEAVLGEGGSSVIYRGVHTTIGRTVAIKMLRPELVRNGETVARFLREGRAACRVRHEHVVEATDFGVTPQGDVFLVMEYLEGEDLAELIEREGSLPWPRARAIALQICEAIEAAHTAGVIHRDITLQNCFRVNRERNPDYIKVIDFGIAKMLEASAPEAEERGVSGNAEIFGTPEYMAPEQVRRTIDADARTDVYALGAVLYALVTGRLPLRGATALDTLVRQIYEDVVPPSQVVPGIPRQLEQAIMRALEKDPEARFQSMAEFASVLERVPALGLVERSATTAAAQFVPEGPITDPDLPELAEHDMRGELPTERLIGRSSRSWFVMRWPMVAAAACALLLVGVSALDREPAAPTEGPTSPVQASAVEGSVLPVATQVLTSPAADMPRPEPTTTSPMALPERAIAVADPATSRTKPGKMARRGAGRRAEAEAALDLAEVGVPTLALVTPSEELPVAVEANVAVDTNIVEAGAEPATAKKPPTPDPFAPSVVADEIKDPFSTPQ